MQQWYYTGFDVGSSTVHTAVLDSRGHYPRHGRQLLF